MMSDLLAIQFQWISGKTFLKPIFFKKVILKVFGRPEDEIYLARKQQSSM
jgi:hypothetical protein